MRWENIDPLHPTHTHKYYKNNLDKLDEGYTHDKLGEGYTFDKLDEGYNREKLGNG